MANSSVYILNQDLDMVAVIDEYEELEWNRSDFGIGSFTLSMDSGQFNPIFMQKGYWVVPADPSNSTSATRQYPYRIEQIEIMFDATGRDSEVVLLTGRSVGGIFEDTLILPDPGMDYHTMKGNAEMVLKHYVDENRGPGAVDPARRLPNFEIAPNLNRGPVIYYKARYNYMSDVLLELSNVTGFGWEVYLDPARKMFVFDIIEGEDRREGTTGAVVLDVNFDSVSSQRWITTDLDRKTYAYVALGEPEEVEEYHSCSCNHVVTRFQTEVMGNDTVDFFMIDNEKFDFEIGALTQVFAHEAGHLELAVNGSSQGFIENVQTDFVKGDLTDVVATAAGGVELEVTTHEQVTVLKESFESPSASSTMSLTFPGLYSNMDPWARIIDIPPAPPAEQRESKAFDGVAYMEVKTKAISSSGSAVFSVRAPAHETGSYARTLTFRFWKSAGQRPWKFNIALQGLGLYNNLSPGAPYDDYELYGPNGSLVIDDLVPATEGWYYVVVHGDTRIASNDFTENTWEVTFNETSSFDTVETIRIDDVQFLYTRMITGTPGSGIGTRVSPAFGPLVSGTSGAKSRLEFDLLTPAGTEIIIETAVTNSSSTKPEDWQYQVVPQSGNGVPQIQGQDVNGKYLWIRQTLKADSPDKTPTVNQLAFYMDQTFYVNGNRVSAVDLSTVGTNRSSIIEWVSDEPQGTSVIVETAVNGGGWMKASNGETVPGLTVGQDLSSVTLNIRSTLYSDNPEVTPKLQELACFFNKNAYAEPTGFDRREVFVEARGSKGVVARTLKGDSKLRSSRTPDIFETTINPNGAFQYREHWDVGDTVTVSNTVWGVRKDIRIVGVKYVANEDGYDLSVELGNPLPTLKSNVKREIERSTELKA